MLGLDRLWFYVTVCDKTPYMVLRPTLKLVNTQTSVTGGGSEGKRLPPKELLLQLKYPT